MAKQTAKQTEEPPFEPTKHESLPGQMDLPFDGSRDPQWQEKHSLLVTTLQTAVPLWVLHLRDVPFEDRQRRAQECAQIVAEKGDIILFRGSNPGETAKAFNALAEGIATLSFQPGGVKVFGEHWEAEKILAGFGHADPMAELTDGLLNGVV